MFTLNAHKLPATQREKSSWTPKNHPPSNEKVYHSTTYGNNTCVYTCIYMYVSPQDYEKSLDMLLYYAYIRLYVIVC